MLRTELKIPILAISLKLYDDSMDTTRPEMKKIQWFDENSDVGSKIRGERVLIVDEVDDSRATLQFAVEEVIKCNAPRAVCVAVVHNKIKEKKGVLPEGVTYFAGADVENQWNCYPWDAAAYGNSIVEYEKLAEQRSGGGE